MSLFGKKQKEETVEVRTEATTATKEAKNANGIAVPHDATAPILKPRITEKASLLLERNVYTFEVAKGATKQDVRDAVKALYKVTPIKVAMVNKAPRRYLSRTRGRVVKESGLRKAHVYLKKGDRIDLV